MSKIRSIEEDKTNDEEIDIALLFAKWLTNNRGLDFDTYVEMYGNNLEFKKEVDKQTELVEYTEVKKRR